LTRDYNRSRSIDLLPPKGGSRQAMAVNTTMVLPLVGAIAAGQPIEAVQATRQFSRRIFVRSKEVFVLEVRGDSMQDEAILSGDYVMVEKSRTAHNGDIVVALVEGTDATLKRFYREGEKIRLQPSNANMQPFHRARGVGGGAGKGDWGVEESIDQFSVLQLSALSQETTLKTPTPGHPPGRLRFCLTTVLTRAYQWPLDGLFR